MPNRQRIGPRLGPISSDFEPSHGPLSAIPYDLLKEASRRLGIMSLAGAALWVLAIVPYHLAVLKAQPGGPWPLNAIDAIAAVSALVSVALFFYTRGEQRNPRLILDLGLGYMVLISLALSLVIHWDPMPHRLPLYPMISWSGPVILMFAAIVPSAPAKTLTAGFIAASMNPLAMLIARARGTWDFSPASAALVMHYPDYLLAGVAAVISHVVTKLGRQVTKAREMGSYELLNLLGKGGMGEVWRARHRMLTRNAAIKLVQPNLLNRAADSKADIMLGRFQQEARTTALLRSPHTVELYDYGVTDDGVFYYVMELLDGIDLETLVNKFGPQPASRVVNILCQVCRSLGDAHRHGMIHRDIKPNNIFLCRMGNEFDYVKVLDFGLVKVIGDDGQLTGQGATMGTPAYMAPELAKGEARIDGRCDVYGLGCVAYWLLTGSLVFEESNATAMILAHLQKIPVRPSERSELPVPAALDRVIMMCLEKDPADRPAGVGNLRRTLGNCECVDAWTQDDAERWWCANTPEIGVRFANDTVAHPSTLG